MGTQMCGFPEYNPFGHQPRLRELILLYSAWTRLDHVERNEKLATKGQGKNQRL